MKRWRLTRKARTDLANIWNYTADLWGVVQAERYIRQIETELTAASQGAALARPIDAFWRVKVSVRARGVISGVGDGVFRGGACPTPECGVAGGHRVHRYGGVCTLQP